MKHRLLFRVSVPVIVICTLGAVQSGEHSFTVFSEHGITVSETSGGPRYQGEQITTIYRVRSAIRGFTYP